MTKFKFVTTDAEYTKILAYYDGEISFMQRSTESTPEKREAYYCKLINDRDELLNHAAALKLKGIS